MDYLKILETADQEIIAKAVSILNESGVRYKLLNDYKLLPEKNFGESEGGAIILVLKKDVIRANHILYSNQIIKQLHKNTVEFSFVEQVENCLNKIPLIKNWSLSFKVMFSIFILMFTPSALLFYCALENEHLPIQEYSCVEKIEVDGQILEPNTISALTFNFISCNERVLFTHDSNAFLPGFNTKPIKGFWKIADENDKLVIFNVESYKEVYEDTFQIKRKLLSNYSIELISDNKLIKLVKR